MCGFLECVGAAVLVIAGILQTDGIQGGRECTVFIFARDSGSVKPVKCKGGRLLPIYCRDKGAAGAFLGKTAGPRGPYQGYWVCQIESQIQGLFIRSKSSTV